MDYFLLDAREQTTSRDVTYKQSPASNGAMNVRIKFDLEKVILLKVNNLFRAYFTNRFI